MIVTAGRWKGSAATLGKAALGLGQATACAVFCGWAPLLSGGLSTMGGGLLGCPLGDRGVLPGGSQFARLAGGEPEIWLTPGVKAAHPTHG